MASDRHDPHQQAWAARMTELREQAEAQGLADRTTYTFAYPGPGISRLRSQMDEAGRADPHWPAFCDHIEPGCDAYWSALKPGAIMCQWCAAEHTSAIDEATGRTCLSCGYASGPGETMASGFSIVMDRRLPFILHMLLIFCATCTRAERRHGEREPLSLDDL